MDDYEIHRKAKNNNRLSGLLEASERYDSSSLNSNENGRTAGNIDSLDREALQAERQSDRYGYRKDADNDNTSKKRYSRDVDYAEYADLKRENKHLKEVQSIDVLYAVNAKKEVAALDEPEFRPIKGTALTTSTISIFNLLDYVNNCFPDILPEERKISVSSFLICLIMQAKTSTAELRLKIILSILSILITKNKLTALKIVKKLNYIIQKNSYKNLLTMQGNETFELSRGQRTITDEDILKLPQLLNNIDYAEYAGKYNGMQNSNNDFINLKSSKDDAITIGAFKQKKYLDLRIHTMYAKNKGNNDDTANAKALASTSETSVGNVSFNSSISNLLDYVNNCSLDILPEEQKKDMLNYHAK